VFKRIKIYWIVGGPRSGSTWLEFLLLEDMLDNKLKPTRLGEYFQPDVAKNEQFKLSITNQIVHGKKQWETAQETVEGRLLMLQQGNQDQSLTMRLFPQNYFFNFVDYIDLAKKISDCNFKFISLYRDIFSRAVSWAIMDQTSIIHLFDLNKVQYHTTFQGNKEKTKIESIKICPINFTRILLMAVQDDISRRMICDVVESVEVNYDSLTHDIQQLGISERSTQISPVHELPYNKIITNYDQLQKIYHELKNTL
jgi:hypothetical protein